LEADGRFQEEPAGGTFWEHRIPGNRPGHGIKVAGVANLRGVVAALGNSPTKKDKDFHEYQIFSIGLPKIKNAGGTGKKDTNYAKKPGLVLKDRAIRGSSDSWVGRTIVPLIGRSFAEANREGGTAHNRHAPFG